VTKAPIVESNLQVKDTILQVMSLTNSEVEDNGVSARVRFAESLPLVYGRMQLQQVMMNISVNAIEAMSNGGGPRELSIETEIDTQGNVIVAVRDSDLGFRPNEMKQIFDPFYTKKASGMG
jgi:C4-dicarboxylate-specific signal transduction histidine kinase